MLVTTTTRSIQKSIHGCGASARNPNACSRDGRTLPLLPLSNRREQLCARACARARVRACVRAMPSGDGLGYGGRASPPLPFRKPPPPPNKPSHLRSAKHDGLEALRLTRPELFRQRAWASREEYEHSKAALLASPTMVRPSAQTLPFLHKPAEPPSSWMPAPPPGKAEYKARAMPTGAATLEAGDPLPERRHGSPESRRPPPLRQPIATQVTSRAFGSYPSAGNVSSSESDSLQRLAQRLAAAQAVEEEAAAAGARHAAEAARHAAAAERVPRHTPEGGRKPMDTSAAGQFQLQSQFRQPEFTTLPSTQSMSQLQQQQLEARLAEARRAQVRARAEAEAAARAAADAVAAAAAVANEAAARREAAVQAAKAASDALITQRDELQHFSPAPKRTLEGTPAEEGTPPVKPEPPTLDSQLEPEPEVPVVAPPSVASILTGADPSKLLDTSSDEEAPVPRAGDDATASDQPLEVQTVVAQFGTEKASESDEQSGLQSVQQPMNSAQTEGQVASAAAACSRGATTETPASPVFRVGDECIAVRSASVRAGPTLDSFLCERVRPGDRLFILELREVSRSQRNFVGLSNESSEPLATVADVVCRAQVSRPQQRLQALKDSASAVQKGVGIGWVSLAASDGVAIFERAPPLCDTGATPQSSSMSSKKETPVVCAPPSVGSMFHAVDTSKLLGDSDEEEVPQPDTMVSAPPSVGSVFSAVDTSKLLDTSSDEDGCTQLLIATGQEPDPQLQPEQQPEPEPEPEVTDHDLFPNSAASIDALAQRLERSVDAKAAAISALAELSSSLPFHLLRTQPLKCDAGEVTTVTGVASTSCGPNRPEAAQPAHGSPETSSDNQQQAPVAIIDSEMGVLLPAPPSRRSLSTRKPTSSTTSSSNNGIKQRAHASATPLGASPDGLDSGQLVDDSFGSDLVLCNANMVGQSVSCACSVCKAHQNEELTRVKAALVEANRAREAAEIEASALRAAINAAEASAEARADETATVAPSSPMQTRDRETETESPVSQSAAAHLDWTPRSSKERERMLRLATEEQLADAAATVEQLANELHESQQRLQSTFLHPMGLFVFLPVTQ